MTIAPHRVETTTLDCFIDYKQESRTIELFNSLQKQFPLESFDEIHKRRLAVQQRCRDIMYELNPDDNDWDYFKNGWKERRKKPKLKYKYYEHLTIVSSDLEKHHDLEHDQFIRELKKWARNRPLEPGEETADIISDALEKYSKLLISNPPSTYKNQDHCTRSYMKAIVNNRLDLWKYRNAKKRQHEQLKHQDMTDDTESPVELAINDRYEYDTLDWLAELTPNQREGLKEAIDYIDSQPDDLKIKVPEKIKRKIRGIQAPCRELHSNPPKVDVKGKVCRPVQEEVFLGFPVKIRKMTAMEGLQRGCLVK